MLTNANKKMPKVAKIFHCEHCDFTTCRLSNFEKHKSTQKHLMLTNANEMLTFSARSSRKKCQKMPMKYYCKICDYSSNKLSNYEKHLASDKHKVAEVAETATFATKNAKPFVCLCGKQFNQKSSLSRHKRECDMISGQNFDNETLGSENVATHTLDSFNDTDKDTLIFELLKQNRELIQNQGINNSHNTMTNSNNTNTNKTFNLNFFLNETCKDAMNITDFVSSLKLTIQDLEKVGELGYSEGISRMFVKGLNDLEVERRPIHCSDLKREVIHIKDQDRWERDTINQDKLKRAIKDLSTKNLMLMDDWQRINPGWKDPSHTKNDIYLKMMVESLGPADEIAEKKDLGKIIKTIAKNTIINKSD